MISKLPPYLFEITIIIFLYFPTFLFLSGFIGKLFFFPSYTIACTIYTALVILLLRRIRHNIPWPLLFVLLIIKLLFTQIILLFIFTPVFDYTAFIITLHKLCSPEDIRFSNNQLMEEGCTSLKRLLGY